MGILAALYAPAESEATSRMNPRSGFETVTLAPGTTAPVESVTVPVMVAVSWAHIATGIKNRVTKRSRAARRAPSAREKGWRVLLQRREACSMYHSPL